MCYGKAWKQSTTANYYGSPNILLNNKPIRMEMKPNQLSHADKEDINQ